MRPVLELPLSAAGILVEHDGRQLRLRPVRSADLAGIQAGFQRMSPQSRYYRFFQMRNELDYGLAASLTDIDHENHFAWGVFDPNEPSEVGDASGLGIAVARLIRDDDPTSAEAAVSVVDDYQGRGIGRFLIKLLDATAADIGLETIRFEILRENRPMIGLVASAGATQHRNPSEASIVEYHLAVPGAVDVAAPIGALYELLRHVDDITDKPDEDTAGEAA